MKIYKQFISECQNCPSIKYTHFDGEGESAPYQYWYATCSEENEQLPRNLIIHESREIYTRREYKPKRIIPSWCPLEDVYA